MKHIFKIAGIATLLLLSTDSNALTATWNGGGADDNWSSSDNWNGTTLVGGEDLVFGGLQRLTNVNDTVVDTLYAGITFNNTAGAFSLSGNRLTLGGSIVNNDTQTQMLSMDMILGATRTLNAASGSFYLNGVLSGAGGLVKSGAQITVLSGNNTYEGTTTVSVGVLRAAHSNALGSPLAETAVADGGRLELAGNITVTGEPVSLVGRGGNNNGSLQVQAGTNTWAGPILIGNADTRIGVTAPTGALIVSGTIDDGPNTYPLIVRNANDGGPVVIAGTNTYGGETQIVVGLVKLSDGPNRLPTQTVIRLGNIANQGYSTLDLNGQNQTVAGITQESSTSTRKIINGLSNQVATLTVNTILTNYSYSAQLSGNLNLEKTGTYTLTLTGNNDFTGVASVRQGTVLLGVPYAVMDAVVNTGDGPMGTLAFGTNTVVNFGGLVGTNALALTNASGVAVSLRVRGNQVCAFDGMITNGCDFTKTGFGFLSLNEANFYTGRTTLAGGTLKIASESSLGVYPSTFVQDQIVFDGGTLKADTNFTLVANNRGITLAGGGGTLMTGSLTSLFTLNKRLVGPGPFATSGLGVVLVTESNAYDGVTTVNAGVLRITDNHGLGSAAGGTVVVNGSQLELGNGVAVSNETVIANGAGITPEPPPPTVPNTNRGALQSAANATAEWSGPVLLGSNQARFGAQNGGHLIISGVIDDGAATYAIRTSSSPSDRARGVELRAHNTYGGSTDLTRGTLLLGLSDALPTATTLDVHWAGSNNDEYTGLDMNGFDQTIGALKNSGNTGFNAMITNRSASVATLTVNQTTDTVYGGTIHGPIALVKDGAGRLTLAYPTRYSGATTLRGGTLALGMNNVISSASAVVLEGGTLDLNSTTNTFSSLTVSASSTIALGSGQLLFSAQTTNAWSGQLSLTGTLGPISLRTQPLLTPDQLARIRYDGKRVSQDADGYLSPFYGTLIRIF